jgi:transposase InsO family protein
VNGLELLLEVEIEEEQRFLLVDSGASLSVMKPGISHSKIEPTQTVAKGVTGNRLRAIGSQDIMFSVGSRIYTHKFLVAHLDVEYSGILGLDALRQMEAKVDLRTSTLVLGRSRHQLAGQEVERCALVRRHPHSVREASQTDLINPETTGPKAPVGTPTPGISRGRADVVSWEVVASGPVVIPPLSQAIVVGKIKRGSIRDVPREVMVEPVSVGTPGAYVARVVSQVYTRSELDELKGLEVRPNRKHGTSCVKVVGYCQKGTGLSLQDSQSNAARYCVLKVLNTSRRHLEVGKHVRLGTAEAILPCAPRGVGFDTRHSGADGTSAGRVHVVRGHNSAELRVVRTELERKLAHLSAEESQILIPVLNQYEDLFCNDREGVLPSTTKGYHEIRTGDALPIKKNPYRVPYALRDEMKNQVGEMLTKGVITPCASPWAAPVILVTKKSADGKPRFRFCTDFRGLNSVTSIPVYPIPDIKSNLSLMAGSKYFTLLDIENAYWNIPIKEEDKDKTGFVTPFGSFRYEKMAFGLAGAPATFSKVMDAVLVGLRDVEFLVYLDDILIFSDTISEHARRMRLVLERIREANFKLGMAKCVFAAPKVSYLGHILSEDGVSPDESKVTAIRNFPRPKTVRDIRAFLGLSGYYRSFIKEYAAISRPLTQLTKKDAKFEWSEAQQLSFDKLKDALTSDSVLAHPRFDLPFILSCDASNYAVSAILSQLQNGKERPICFASRMLIDSEGNYSTTHKELLAIVFGTQTHRCFLYGRKFKVITDHAPLKWLITVKNHQCARLTRWVLKLSEYEFEIEHKPGKKHSNADCLSRYVGSMKPEVVEREETKDLTDVGLTREVVLSEQSKDPYCRGKVEDIGSQPETGFILSTDGLLYKGDKLTDAKLVVPETLIRYVLQMHHDKVFAGHQGIKRTRDLLKLHYYWPNMNRDVDQYIKNCESCSKLKVGRNPTAPLGELPETSYPLELTSIDICGPYPETKRGNRYLLTFIDHFSRYPEAIPLPRQDAPTVARALVTEIFSRLGCPRTISSDKGTNFMSELFQEVCKLLQVKRINSTSFNPQMQGKVEKFHLGLNQSMSHYVNKYGNDWDEFVNYALMAHRSVPHSITRYSPFYLLYGREMRLPTEDDLSPEKSVTTNNGNHKDSVQHHLETLADRLNEAYQVVRENNREGRERQKDYYNRGTKLVTFQPGDMVYLKEMNLRKIGAKFKTRWKGPYEVIRRLSDLNYLVKLSRSKETVVNVNKMKKCFRQTASNPTTERRGVRDLAEDKRETLETHDPRYNGAGAMTDHSETNTEDVTGNPTQDIDDNPYSLTRTQTSSCRDVGGREGRSVSPTDLMENQTSESHQDVGDCPQVVEGGGSTLSLWSPNVRNPRMPVASLL